MRDETLPAFSIIVPIYNGQHVVEHCINSVLQQDYQFFELILIDDGSIDQTANICQNYCDNDTRIKYFKQANKGVSSARNHGLKVMRNEYILFVDADDYLLPNFLSDFSNIIKRNTTDKKTFIFQDFIADLKHVDGEKQSYKWCKFTYGKYSLAEAFEALQVMNWLNWGVPFAKVYQSSIIRSNNISFNEEMSFREDLIFMLDYIAHIEILIFDPTANYCYTIDNTKNSLSNTTASFNNEIIFFDYSKQMANSYINKFKLSSETQLILYKMVYASFFRCINSCMYKYKIPMNRADRIKNIKLLATKDNINALIASGIIDTKMKHLAFTLLKNKLYKLYDLVNNIRFAVS